MEPRYRHLGTFLQLRVRDGVLLRLIGKWLNAGVMEVLPKRFGKYGLTIHPTKTRLVPFCPPTPWATGYRGEPRERPGTFDLLGLTHYWGRSQRGYWIVKWKTASDRFSRAVRSIGNSAALSRFLWEVERRWRKWLYRRNRLRSLNWSAFRRTLDGDPSFPENGRIAVRRTKRTDSRTADGEDPSWTDTAAASTEGNQPQSEEPESLTCGPCEAGGNS